MKETFSSNSANTASSDISCHDNLNIGMILDCIMTGEKQQPIRFSFRIGINKSELSDVKH